MRRCWQWLSALLLCCSHSVNASIDSDLNNFFDHLGFAANATSAHAYQGQEAGYYTGGSVYARNSVRDLEIVNVQLPKIRAGCGGIDLFTGGVSFVNGQQMIDTLYAVMNNAGGYGASLALEETIPQAASSMKYFNNLAQDINRFNINSCETGTALVGSMWPKTRETERQLCQDLGSSSGHFADYVAARRGCSTGGEVSSVLKGASGAEKAMVITNTNIAWQALTKNSLLKSDTELAELFMSLSGTLVIKAPSSDDANNEMTPYPSLVSDRKLLKALLEGGDAHIYVCDETEDCLNPKSSRITISTEHALKYRVKALLNDMANKIITDEALTDEEKGLLNATSIPVYKMLTVQAATTHDPTILDIEGYADVIASDMLFQYLSEALSVVHARSALLPLPEEKLVAFQKGISEAERSVRDQKQNAYQQMNMSAQLIERTQNLERMLMGQLSTHLNHTITWAQGLKGGAV